MSDGGAPDRARGVGVRHVLARGGDALGSFGALGGPRIGRDAMVTRSGIALRIDRDELFEMLGERPEMLRQLFAGMVDASRTAGLTV